MPGNASNVRAPVMRTPPTARGRRGVMHGATRRGPALSPSGMRNCRSQEVDEDVDMLGGASGGSSPSVGDRTAEPAEEAYASRADSAVSPVSVDGADAESMFEEEDCTPHASNTVIIFDWDDTLLASSWLARNGMGLEEPAVVPSHITKPMSQLGRSVHSLLTAAMKRGQVVIITNAETGWVELSAAKFMPELVPLLPKLRVVSARSTYEPLFPDSPSDWKVAAFTQELHSVFKCDGEGSKGYSSGGRRGQSPSSCGSPRKGSLRNVISFGDSVYERTAVHAATSRLGPRHRVLTKSVKFVERPNAEQVRRQVDLVSGCLHDICEHAGALDLMLTIQLLEQHVQQQRAASEAAAANASARAVA